MQSPKRPKKANRLPFAVVNAVLRQRSDQGSRRFLDDRRQPHPKNSNDLSDSPTKLSKITRTVASTSRERVRERKVMLASAERLSTPAAEFFCAKSQRERCAEIREKSAVACGPATSRIDPRSPKVSDLCRNLGARDSHRICQLRPMRCLH